MRNHCTARPVSPCYSDGLYRQIFRSALPGVLLAICCLSPFLREPFTIDDPYFMTEARQVLRTPLTPAAASLCWDTPHTLPLRQIGSPAVLIGYLLVPAVLLGDSEWAAHLIILLFLAAMAIATVALAFRCGCSQGQATLSGLLAVSFPAVLGMAGTAMPDVPVAALSVVGMERLMAWRDEKKLSQALAAALALGIAPLGRSHTLLLIPLGVLVLAGHPWSFSRKLTHWLPIALALLFFLSFTWLTSDPSTASTGIAVVGPNSAQISWRALRANLPQFGVNWMLTAPLGIGWLLLSGWRGVAVLAVTAAGAAARLFPPQYMIGLAGWISLAWVLAWALRRKDAVSLWLALWLWIALPIIIYVHLPSKYIVPCAPPAAILLARRLGDLPAWRRLAASVIAVSAGVALGLAILIAGAAFSGLARDVAVNYIAPEVRAGRTVWHAGAWAFLWYAEKAGASCLVLDPPGPKPGDILIAGEEEQHDLSFFDALAPHKRLLRTIRPAAPGGRVMNMAIHAGFYSSGYGYLPWRWSSAPINTYRIWLIE